MKHLKGYHLSLSSLKEGSHSFDFQLNNQFLKAFEDAPIEKVDAEALVIFEKGLGVSKLIIDIEGTVEVPCDRCLELFDLPFYGEYELSVKFSAAPTMLETEDPDLIVLEPEAQQLYVGTLLYEYLLLSIPLKRTHDMADEECSEAVMKVLRNLQANAQDQSDAQTDGRKNPFDELRDQLNKN